MKKLVKVLGLFEIVKDSMIFWSICTLNTIVFSLNFLDLIFRERIYDDLLVEV